MSESTRAEVLEVLAALSEACPSYRFGQMVANLAMLARGDEEGAVWNLEDAELLAAARKHLRDWQARSVSSDPPGTPAGSARLDPR